MADVFNGLLADPVQLAVYMLIIVGVGVGVTRAGVQKGVERVTKVMMMALFVVHCRPVRARGHAARAQPRACVSI